MVTLYRHDKEVRKLAKNCVVLASFKPAISDLLTRALVGVTTLSLSVILIMQKVKAQNDIVIMTSKDSLCIKKNNIT